MNKDRVLQLLQEIREAVMTDITKEPDITSEEGAVCPFCRHLHDDDRDKHDIHVGLNKFVCERCNQIFYAKCTPIVYEYTTSKDKIYY
jgi:hypothetical protein